MYKLKELTKVGPKCGVNRINRIFETFQDLSVLRETLHCGQIERIRFLT